MTKYVLPVGETWRDNLDELKRNLELLEQNPEADYLWCFIETCLDQARVKHQKEREQQRKSAA